LSPHDPLAVRLYGRAVARLLPDPFRSRYGPAMEAMFRDEWAARGATARVALGVRAIADVGWTAVAERLRASAGTLGGGVATMWGNGMQMDLRTSLRTLRRSPLFTLAAALSLALGVGGVATVYALADHLLLDPIRGVAAPDRLVELSERALPYPVVQDLQGEALRSFTGIAAHRMRTVALELGGGVEARPVQLGIVTGNYFDLLGVAPARGRLLSPADTVPGSALSAVLSHGLWTEMGSPPDVTGTDVRINGTPFRVVGVAPRGFSGLRLWAQPAVWIAVESWPAVSLGRTPDVHSRGWGWTAVVARLAPGVQVGAATDEVRAAGARIGRAHPENDGVLEDVALIPSRTQAAEQASAVLQPLLLALGGMSLLALFAAAANVANLLLARATRRARELAMRVALGAGRGHLARLVAIEGALLVGLGSALGVAISALALRLLGAVRLPGDIRIGASGIAPDARVVLVGGALLVAVVAVSALAPMLTAMRVSAGLAGGDRSGGGAPKGVRLRRVLAGVQVAVGVVLLAGTLLFGQSIVRALSVDLGFDPTHMAVIGVDASLFRDGQDEAMVAVDRLLGEIRERPGVEAAAWSLTPPLSSGADQESFDIVGRAWPDRKPVVEVNAVGSDFFRASGIPLVAGDASAVEGSIAAPVVVVNESMAERYWPGISPVGSSVVIQDMAMQVVAVAADARFHGFGTDPEPTAYGVFLALPTPSRSLVVRGPGAEQVLRSVRGTVRAVDPRMVVTDVATGPRLVDFLLAPQRLGGTVALMFATLALSLCLTGVYGVVAYGVTARLREFGVRLTLGADPGRVAREVVRKNLAATLVGVLLGAGAAVALTRVAAAYLYGVGAGDLFAAGLASACVLGMALGAMWIPARRAGRVDPASVLALE
jgi:predicted permease